MECPLRMFAEAAFATQGEFVKEGYTQCVEENCAWFVGGGAASGGRCAVHDLATSVYFMQRRGDD